MEEIKCNEDFGMKAVSSIIVEFFNLLNYNRTYNNKLILELICLLLQQSSCGCEEGGGCSQTG